MVALVAPDCVPFVFLPSLPLLFPPRFTTPQMKSESLTHCGYRRKFSVFRRSGRSSSLASLLALAALASPLAEAQSPAPPPVAFSFSRLVGLRAGANNKGNKVTSLQFGPDGKLYYVQENGTVWHCNVTRQGPNNYVADALTPINLVKLIPNYDDDGTLNTTLHTRQATGLMVSGTAESPVIYVTSSDPRVGAGSAGDLNLDTNSGVISRLTKNGANWEKVDIVRGLPRSEENHAVNGLSFDPTGTKLLLAVGGSTNAGGPSNNFAFACEDALSAAVLSIDIAAIEAMPILTDGNGTSTSTICPRSTTRTRLAPMRCRAAPITRM